MKTVNEEEALMSLFGDDNKEYLELKELAEKEIKQWQKFLKDLEKNK